MNKLAASVVIAATLASPLLAHAQVRAEAGLSNFSYTLIDLLPDDGITPSLSIVAPIGYAGGSRAYGYIRQSDSAEPEFDDYLNQSTTRYNRNLDVKLGSPAGTANASVNGTDFHSLQLKTSASTSGASPAFRSASGYASANILEFVLSPGTQVSFFADANVATAATAPRDDVFRDNAWAGVSFGVRGNGDIDGLGYDARSINLQASNLIFDDAPPATMSVSERIALTLGNRSASSAKLYLEIATSASVQSQYYGHQSPSAVPEPATTAMLVAGLALIAGTARRRRKAQGQ